MSKKTVILKGPTGQEHEVEVADEAALLQSLEDLNPEDLQKQLVAFAVNQMLLNGKAAKYGPREVMELVRNLTKYDIDLRRVRLEEDKLAAMQDTDNESGVFSAWFNQRLGGK